MNTYICEDDVELNSAVELQPLGESVEVSLGSTFEVNCTTFTEDICWETTPKCFYS